MKDTRGEEGHAGHHRNKRALTDPSFTTTATARPLTPSPPPGITPASDPAARMPSWCVTQGGLWRSGEVGGLHGLLIEWVHWGSMWRSGASPGAEAEPRAARKSRKARREIAGGTLWKRFLHLYRDEFTVAAAQVPAKTQKTWTRHSVSRPLQSSGWTPNYRQHIYRSNKV